MRSLALAFVVGCGLFAVGCAEGSNTVKPPGGTSGSGAQGGAGGSGEGGGASSSASSGVGGQGGAGGSGEGGAVTTSASSGAGGQGGDGGAASTSASSGAGGQGGSGDCGNGIIEPQAGEDCDFDAMGNPLILATCAGIGFPNSMANPGCSASCQYDTKPCQCGDGVVQSPEECDGAALNGATCVSLGYTGGTLSCLGSCDYNTSGCTACGNGVIEAGETCDDGNTTSGDGCSATCQTEVVACDPDGVYTKQGAQISYTCCLGLVTVNVSSFIFSANGASIATSPSNPVTMTGAATTCPMGSFSNSGSIPGGCAETYSLAGSFIDQNTWSGTYSMTFTGPDCSCFGGMFGTPCINQVFPVTAVR